MTNFVKYKGKRVLVISRDSWNDINNSGNTLSNFFQTWDSDYIANIYCREEIPNNSVCNKYFKLSESQIIKNVFGLRGQIGIKHGNDGSGGRLNNNTIATEKKIYDLFRRYRFSIALLIRDLLWKVSAWRSSELDRFIKEFKPDLIFTISYDSLYMYDIIEYVRFKAKVPIVSFHCDDNATFKQLSFDPLFWINRYLVRRRLYNLIYNSNLNYCITNFQCKVYQNIFKKEFYTFYKFGDFTKRPTFKEPHDIIKIVYTGNIIYGRWKTISKVASALHQINMENRIAEIDIYSASEITSEIAKAFNFPGTLNFKGKVSPSQIPEVLSGADILLHVESLELEEKLKTALSFSTKIVDYLQAGRCILAFGWSNCASIKYLSENGAAEILTDYNNIDNKLKSLLNNKNRIVELGVVAWEVGKRNHSRYDLNAKFVRDIESL